mgnify:CR=1 FL=1
MTSSHIVSLRRVDEHMTLAPWHLPLSLGVPFLAGEKMKETAAFLRDAEGEKKNRKSMLKAQLKEQEVGAHRKEEVSVGSMGL